MNINLESSTLNKLIDIGQSGASAIFGPLLAEWQAKRYGKARLAAAKVGNQLLLEQAAAQAKAREILIPEQGATVQAELSMEEMISQKIRFQEEKRINNIHSVLEKSLPLLEGVTAQDDKVDHDWTARFFNDAQDVSSGDMQLLWAKVLAGEVERTGTTSIRTLAILKNLDLNTARLFQKLRSLATVIVDLDSNEVHDARVPGLDGNPAENSLMKYGLGYGNLNLLNEHGLIVPDYNSYMAYSSYLFQHQGDSWTLVSTTEEPNVPLQEGFRLHGVALTRSGIELLKVVDIDPAPAYTGDLMRFFETKNIQMIRVLTAAENRKTDQDR